MTLYDDARAAVTAAEAEHAAIVDTQTGRVAALEDTLAQVRALHSQTRASLAAALAEVARLTEQLRALRPRRLGWYNGGPAVDVEPLLGGVPEISSTYYQPNQAALNIPAERDRIAALIERDKAKSGNLNNGR